MYLLDEFRRYHDITLYLSSGSDFYIVEELYNNKVKSDLIIMCDCYIDAFESLNNFFNGDNFDLRDEVVHNYKIKVSNVKDYNIDLDIDERLLFRKSKLLNKIKLFDIKYIKDDLIINKKIMFVVSENLTFMHYLIENNINVKNIYVHGVRGSNLTLDSTLYMFDLLKTKLYITNDIYLGYKNDEIAQSVFNIEKYKKNNLKQLFVSKYNQTYFRVLKTSRNVKYKVHDFKHLKYIINNKIFKIEIGTYESQFSEDTYLNGILFKKNSNKNIIGLDIILNTGIILKKDYVIFKSASNIQTRFDIVNCYDQKYLLINNKFISSFSKIPSELREIGIYRKFKIQNEYSININGCGINL